MQRSIVCVAAAAPVLFVLTACSSPSETSPVRERPPRELLTERLARLGGSPVEVASNGPWHVRRIGRPESEAGHSLAITRRTRTSAPGAVAEAAPVAVEGRALADGGAPGPAPGPAGPGTPGPEGLPAPAFDAAPGAPVLRAGSYDDNADFDAFVAFLEKHREARDLEGRWQWLDVRDRRTVRVVDGHGAPVPAAEVTIVDEDDDRAVWRARTYGDGAFPFYPAIAAGEGGDTDRPWLVEVRYGDATLRHHWNGRGEEFVVELPGQERSTAPVQLDVVFLIDTTGSMGDEIDRIKTTLLGVTERLRSLEREFSLHYGAVLYRDVGDVYVTSRHPFTADIAAFDTALQAITADGGGDGPESLNQGLAVAVDAMEWRPGSARLVFLIADAPPHLDYENDVPYGDGALAALARGIKVHAVAASGLDAAGSVVFRQIAQLTRGDFIFIEYGGDVAASATSHGVTGKVASNNLDEILFSRIRDEIAAWGRP